MLIIGDSFNNADNQGSDTFKSKHTKWFRDIMIVLNICTQVLKEFLERRVFWIAVASQLDCGCQQLAHRPSSSRQAIIILWLNSFDNANRQVFHETQTRTKNTISMTTFRLHFFVSEATGLLCWSSCKGRRSLLMRWYNRSELGYFYATPFN